MAAKAFTSTERVTGFVLTTAALLITVSANAGLLFSGTSLRNATGHWITMMKITQEDMQPIGDADKDDARLTYNVAVRSLSRGSQPKVETTILVAAPPYSGYNNENNDGVISPMTSLIQRRDDKKYKSVVTPTTHTSTTTVSTTRVPTTSLPTKPTTNLPEPIDKEDDVDHPGFKRYKGVGSYKLHVEKYHWWDAERVCIAEGAHLALINSKEEEDAIKDLRAPEQHVNVFLGFKYSDTIKQFRTIGGYDLDSLGYLNWEGDQPPKGQDLDCGVVRPSGQISVARCHWAYPFICELDTTDRWWL